MNHSVLFPHLCDLYEALETELGAVGVTCRACGHCCHFDEMDHVLYASRAEAAYATENVTPQTDVPTGRCPYQVEERCRAGAFRPLGCRLFFCITSSAQAEALEALSQTYHAALQRLHDQHGVPWVYRPFLKILSEERVPPASASS